MAVHSESSNASCGNREIPDEETPPAWKWWGFIHISLITAYTFIWKIKECKRLQSPDYAATTFCFLLYTKNAI